MKKHIFIIVIAAIVLLMAGVIAVLWFALSAKPNEPQDTGTGQSFFPIGTDVRDPTKIAPPTVVTTARGEAIGTQDFIRNGAIPDVVNPGSYVLAGSLGYCLYDGSCPKATDDTNFSISFNESSSEFIVVLLAEPIGASRLAAEAFLRTKLGIKDADLCRLKYYVGVPYTVNSVYTGGNLGFSFCPGATTLP